MLRSPRPDRSCRQIDFSPAIAVAAVLSMTLLSASAFGQSVGTEQKAVNVRPLLVRVGIHTYASDGILQGEELARYQQLFQEVADNAHAKTGVPVHIQAAAGDYGVIYHWCKYGMIDVAVVTAGVYSQLVEHMEDRWRYLCTMGQGDDWDRFEYGVRCVVSNDSTIASFEDIKAAANANALQVELVKEHSTSGGIFPRALLKELSIPIQADDIVYAGTHANCLAELAKASDGGSTDETPVNQIGFVWDGALAEGLEQGLAVHALDLPPVSSVSIPESAVVVRSDFYAKHGPLLDQLHTARSDFQRIDDFENKYGKIQEWSHALDLPPPQALERTDWVGLFEQLRRYIKETGQAPRIALVLSGGGAKCAFQVGVVQNLEREFQRFRDAELAELCEEKGVDLDDCNISLVVGTSGGAINALPVALGTYTTDEGVQTIERVWESLDARDILQPELPVRCGIGALIYLVLVIMILLAVRLRFASFRLVKPESRGIVVSVILLVAGSALFAWKAADWKFDWGFLDALDPGLFVLWALLRSGAGVTGGLLLATGLLVGAIDFRKRRHGATFFLSPAALRETVAWLMLSTLVLAIPVTMAVAQHLSSSDGLEEVIRGAGVQLVNERLGQRGLPPLETDDLAGLSRTILDRQLLERDLIITATILPEDGEVIPYNDLYFFAESASIKNRRNGDLLADARCRPLTESGNREVLLQAVLGSGTVFPVFPARTISNYPAEGKSLNLVDGSYSHHSPIEAAVKWGASHVIQVEPSAPESAKFRPDNNLYKNSSVALKHLFAQAQNVDRQAQKSVTVFTINPEIGRQRISLLSFAREPIAKAIEQGNQTRRHTGTDNCDGEDVCYPFQRSLPYPVFLRELDTHSNPVAKQL